MEDPVIVFDHVSFEMDGLTFVQDVSFSVRRGEHVVVFGPTGCGKSLLTRLTLGLIKPKRGQVKVYGTDLATYSQDQLLDFRRRIGTIFRGARLISNMTVAENVALPLDYHTRWAGAEIEDRAQSLLRLLEIEEYQDKRPVYLNDELRMRAAVARALALRPRGLVCDDPTAGLCPVTSARLVRTIYALADFEDVTAPFSEGTSEDDEPLTSFIVTSKLSDYLEFGDRFSLFREGNMDFLGGAADVLSSEDPYVSPMVRGEGSLMFGRGRPG